MPKHTTWLIAVGLGACLCACAADDATAISNRRATQTQRAGSAGRSSASPKQVASVNRAANTDPGDAQNDSPLLTPASPSVANASDSDAGLDSTCDAGSFCAPTQPDPDDCGKLTLQAEPKVVENPGNVLLIFDRSGSMRDDWDATAKWQAAGDAVVKALRPLQDKLTIGAVLFPSPPPTCDPTADDCSQRQRRRDDGPTCDVNPISALDELSFKRGADALNELETGNGGAPKYQPQQGGGTPTSEAIAQADAALRAMTLTGTTAVVIITDGEPNCEWDQAQSTATLMNWAASLAIKTHVIGLPGAADGGGPAVLTALAQAGQTGDYITPTDAQALQTRLADIISHTVTTGFDSCEIKLAPAAKVPTKLHLLVTTKGTAKDVPHMFAGQTEPAWTVSADGASVQLLGNLCENVKAGTYESITFVFGCVDVPPFPPPDPPPTPI